MPENQEPLKTENAPETYLTTRDYVVSGETFTLRYQAAYDLLITIPQPSPERLPEYYPREGYLSYTQAPATLFEKVYRLIRRHTLKRKLAWLSQAPKGSLLDIGAGTGDFLAAAQRKGWHVWGVEPNAQARAQAQDKEIQVLPALADLPPQKYDVITLWHVLEHIPDSKEQVRQLAQLLKPGGILAVAVPNYKCFDAAHYGAFWAAYDVPRHLWHFSQRSIRLLAEENGLQVVKTIPMVWDAFYISLLSERYRTGRMRIGKALYIGLISTLKAWLATGEYSSVTYFLHPQAATSP